MADSETIRVETVPIGDLKLWAENPRYIRRDRLDNLKESINADPDFMWRRPILALGDGTIYGGNQRYRACTELGWKTVPVLYADIPWEEAQERALKDNNTWGDWDDDSLATLVQGLARQDSERVKYLGFGEMELATILQHAQPVPEQTTTVSTATATVSRPEDDLRQNNFADAEEAEEEAEGGAATDADSPYVMGTVKQIILHYPAETFARVIAMLNDVRAYQDTDNNTDAVTQMLEEYAERENLYPLEGQQE